MKLHNRNWWLTENVSLLAFMVKVEAVFGIIELSFSHLKIEFRLSKSRLKKSLRNWLN